MRLSLPGSSRTVLTTAKVDDYETIQSRQRKQRAFVGLGAVYRHDPLAAAGDGARFFVGHLGPGCWLRLFRPSAQNTQASTKRPCKAKNMFGIGIGSHAEKAEK